MKTDNSREPSLNTLALPASPLPHPDSAGSPYHGAGAARLVLMSVSLPQPLENVLILGAWQILPPILNKVRY